MLRTLALSLVFSLPAAAAAVPSPAVGNPLPVGSVVATGASAQAVAAAVRATLLDPAWTLTDPAFAGASDVNVTAQRFGDHFVVRARPQVEGVAVEGADRVLVVDARGVRHVDGAGRSLRPAAQFRVAEHEAMATAMAGTRGSIIVDATVENVSGFARAVWVAGKDGLHPAFRVRVPTFSVNDGRDVWVDGVTGAIVRRAPVAHLGGVCGDGTCDVGEDTTSCPADCVVAGEGEGEGEGEVVGEGEGEAPLPPAPTAARVFEYAPAAGGIDVADLKDVELADLLPADIGGPLAGFHFETANCCKKVVCNDGSQDCLSTLPAGALATSVATCATEDDIADGIAFDSVVQPPDGIPRDSLAGVVPAQFLNQLPDPIFVKVAFCAELPRARSTAANGADPAGWFETPVDGDRATPTKCGLAGADPIGCAAEEDAFAEVTVYNATQVYFEHIRAVLDDETFCLGGLSQQCEADGSAVLGDDGKPVRPFHIGTNVLFPAFDFQALAGQLLAGQGATAGNPIIIEDFQRIPNAAFIPALEGGPIQIPPGLEALASLFSRPFDSNVYFQGSRDFAYDGDVTRHEFTHALVHHFVPNLGSNGKDDFGTNAESGGLNEGWADYFSSSFIGNSEVGEYAGQGLGQGGETGLRNNDNEKKCPDDIIGEVHADSEPWAGALWAIRDEVTQLDGSDPKDLDRAVLEALALAEDDEDMARAAGRVVTAVTAAYGDTLGAFAQAEFDRRGLSGCERIHVLSTVDGDGITVARKDLLFQPGAQDVGLTNFAPSVLQFKVSVPPGSGGFTLSWAEQAGGLGGGSPGPISVVVHEVTGTTGRIHWSYEGNGESLAVPRDDAGDEIDFDATASAATIGTANADGISSGSFTQTLTSDGCNARDFIISFVAPEGGSTMSNIDVDNIATDTACANEGEGEGEGEGDAPGGCPCSGGNGTPSSLAFFGLALMALRRVRR